MRRVVEFGDVWHPVRAHLEMLAERAGRDPQEIGIAVREPVKIVSDPNLSSDTWPLLGTVKQVVDYVSGFRDGGVRYLVMDTFYGIPELHGETADDMLATMERFAKEVMPQFPEP